MSLHDLVQQVRTMGEYPTDAEAERVLRCVLSMLGGHLGRAERVELARRLPPEAAAVVTDQLPAEQPLSAAEFVAVLAERLHGATPATARWDAGAVLASVAELAGDDFTERLLDALPRGYALLFGRADLTPA